MLAVVADSDANRRTALREELERHGHDVREVQTAREVLQAAGEGIGLCVLGWTIEGGDAIDVCRSLKITPGDDEPIVIVAGDEQEVDVHAAVDAGAADVWPVAAGEDPRGTRVRLALAEHYARLQAENLRVGGEFALLRQALDLTGTGFILTDPRLEDDPIVYANRSFLDITGYELEEVLGRNCRFLQGEGTDPGDVDKLREAVKEHRPVTVEILNRRKDGTPFFNEVHVAPVHDERGEVVRFVGVQVNVTTYRAQQQRMVAEQEARIDAERAERRSAWLAEAGPTLDASLDLRTTLESLARIPVPHLADLCLVEAVDGGEARRVAGFAADPRLQKLLDALPAAYRLSPDGEEALTRVLRTGRAEVVDDGRPVVGRPTHELLERRLGPNRPGAWMLVPLRARGRRIGALALARLEEGRSFGPEDLALAEDLALRAGLALDNARLYEEQLSVARTLQTSFLPSSLPAADGLALAGRYRPADTTADLGGDFYDVVELGDGATAIVVGDVTGKGAGAAALTSLARHTTRVGWLYEERPAAVLSTLNTVLRRERSDRGRYCTVVLARFDRVEDGVQVEVVCAGHPAPRVLRADGTVEAIGERGTILGWVETPRLEPATTVLRPGDTFVAFTDGVSAGDDGGPLTADRLEEELVRARELDVDAIAESLQLAALRAQLGRPPDDVVIVAARAT